MSVAAAPAHKPDFDSLSDDGFAFYARQLQPLLEPTHNGEWIAIHVASKEYALGRTSSAALRAVRQSQPNGFVLTMIVGPDPGSPTLDRILARHSRPSDAAL